MASADTLKTRSVNNHTGTVCKYSCGSTRFVTLGVPIPLLRRVLFPGQNHQLQQIACDIVREHVGRAHDDCAKGGYSQWLIQRLGFELLEDDAERRHLHEPVRHRQDTVGEVECVEVVVGFLLSK